MADHIENRVRSIVSRVVDVAPHNIRPESLIYLGEVEPGGLRRIARHIGAAYGIAFAPDSVARWITVADVIEATERAIAADQARRRAA
jgi:hypothetical protein